MTDSRGGMMFPRVGGSWGVTSRSGLGFEVNADRPVVSPAGAARGASFDARMRYVFGTRRYRPYALAGAGYFQYYQPFSHLVPAMGGFPERLNEGRFTMHRLAPLVGGGVRVAVTPKISIRPEVLWYPQPGERSALRASVGVGFGW